MAFTERDLEQLDPLRLDREIARTAEAATKWQRRLRKGDGLDEDPFWSTRLISSRTAFQMLRELPTSDPLRVPLQRWVYRLAEQRINHAASVRVVAERQIREHVVSEPERVRLPLRSMMSRALSEPRRRDDWLRSFVRASDELSLAVATLWERRQEVAARMGLSSVDEMESPGTDVALAASRWLDRTADMLDGSGGDALGPLIGTALAEHATEGWPRHLLPRTILDLFRDSDLFRSVELHPGPLPEMRGPASFMRALARVGASWVDATAPRDQPFVVAHDPYGLRRRTVGALLGRLPAERVFAKRALGVDASRLSDHERILGTAVLVESRAAALRVVLRGPALRGRRAFAETFEHEVERALQVQLPPSAAGAIWQLHEDDPQRFAGLLLSATLTAELRDAHDDDWHRNPRAVEQLRDEARLSPECVTTDDALKHGEDRLYETLARALG